MIDEQAKALEATQLSTPAPDPELFRTIDRAIREERMYTNPNLQRQVILDRFDISRRTLSDLLSAYADGQSFTAYINAMRLQDAVHLLKEEPEMSRAKSQKASALPLRPSATSSSASSA